MDKSSLLVMVAAMAAVALATIWLMKRFIQPPPAAGKKRLTIFLRFIVAQYVIITTLALLSVEHLLQPRLLGSDAAYIRKDKSLQITEEAGQHFLHVCPDFIVELLSPRDNLAKTKAKLEAWINNGVELGWLVDPYRKQVLVYEPGKAGRVETGNVVQGRGSVKGFVVRGSGVVARPPALGE